MPHRIEAYADDEEIDPALLEAMAAASHEPAPYDEPAITRRPLVGLAPTAESANAEERAQLEAALDLARQQARKERGYALIQEGGAGIGAAISDIPVDKEYFKRRYDEAGEPLAFQKEKQRQVEELVKRQMGERPKTAGRELSEEEKDLFRARAEAARRLPPERTEKTDEQIAAEIDALKALAEQRRRLPQPRSIKPDAAEEKKSAITRRAESELRKEFMGSPVTKATQELATAFRKMEKASTDPSAAGDIALVYGFMKMMDPGSTVREGEFATAQNAGGVSDKVQAAYNKALSGTRLAPEIRADFVRRGRQALEAQVESHKAMSKAFSGVAERGGLAKENVILDLGLEPPVGQPVSEADELRMLREKAAR